MHYWVNQFAAAPEVPGGTRHFEFARLLGGLGVPIEIVAADVNLASRRYTRRRGALDLRRIREEVDGVTFHWLHTLTYDTNDWRRSLGMLRFAEAAFAFLLRAPVGPDTVFIGSSPTLFAAAAAERAARVRGARFVLEVRDLWPESLIEMTGREGVSARILRRLSDYLYRRADRIIVLAERNREAIGARGVAADRFVYVPNSVDLDAFAAPAAGDAPRWPLPADRVLAVYAGAHGPANDLGTLLGAAALLRDSDVHLVLVGDGTEKQALVARAQSSGLTNVTFHDPVPKQEIPALLARCDIGVLTLRDLPLFRSAVSPNKLYDYMAAGLPVVTNVAGECSDLVTTAGAGRCAAPGSAQALADALRAAASLGPARRRELGAAGRRYVADHHNRERLVHRLVEVLDRPVAEAPGAAAKRRSAP